tara:strand:- start:88 stop:1020 length:933 start_codon:yes stop_codon:yes gene_type:complete
MIDLQPVNQTKLFGLNKFFIELVRLDQNNNLPNKILLSGLKGLGKSTLAYHFINYVLSKNEEFPYDLEHKQINVENPSFKTVLNKSNPNLNLVDVNIDKKSIDIKQIRELISNLNKSSFNTKPRFILIDNIEYMNINSVNALLKILEEPSKNIYFILINNSKKILSTLSSRCINFKISLTSKESFEVANSLLDKKLDSLINEDLLNYYLTPGKIYNLANFANLKKYDLSKIDLREFLKIIIDDNLYKKDNLSKCLIFDFIEYYFRKINLSFSPKLFKKYSYFMKRISDTQRFNLDEEIIFIEFRNEILNG